MASATEKINEVISLLDKQIIELEARNHINVSMRIDEVIPFLEDVLAVAKDDISTRKFDITQSVGTGCTVSYTINGESASAGSNVLTYGDKLVITATAATGYTLSSLKVNNKNYTSGTEITVTTDIAVIATATLNTYDLTVTPAENSTISVTKGGTPVVAGEDAISYGDTLLISATASEGYQVTALTINGVDYVSDQTVTVTGNISVSTTVVEVPAETPVGE